MLMCLKIFFTGLFKSIPNPIFFVINKENLTDSSNWVGDNAIEFELMNSSS